MPNQLPESVHFGLTRLGAGEPASKNGWALSDSNVVTLDQLIYAALNHTHSGDPALGDPTDPPTMVAVSTGGTLPAGTTFYFTSTFVDQWGLETASSPEASVTTASPIVAPNAAAATVETSSGTVSPGVYSFLITCVDAYGGETTPSPLSSAQVLGGSTNRIRLNLPSLPSGAVSINIYRSRPGQSAFYYLGNSATSTFYDDGSAEDQTIQAPTTNTTNSSNSIQVTIPLGFIPEGCYSWKIYRALASGAYDGTSLVHWVTEGASDTDTTPRIMWTDTGDALQPGLPPDTNSSATSGLLLSYDNLAGSLPLSAMPRGAQVYSPFVPGTPTDNTLVSMTEVPFAVQPTRFTAFFKTPPTDVGVAVRFRVADSAGTPNYIEVACSPITALGGDPAGYFHVEYPLYTAESFEAEDGTRSSMSTVAIASDVAASSGQAVALASNGDYVQVDLGSLDPGTYQTFVTARVLQYASSSTNDLVFSVIRTDTNAVVGSPVSYTLTSGLLYTERNGPTFTAPGGVDLVLRVAKATATAQAYNVDFMRFTATVPTLQAGPLTVTSYVDSGPSTSADVNLAMWF